MPERESYFWPQGRAGGRPQTPSADAPRSRSSADWDEIVFGFAATQHGVVSRRQLLQAGLSPAGIRHRLNKRRLHHVHPGVYAVGHKILAPRGWWMAAVLAGGDGALLSHRAAAALWGLIDGYPSVTDVLVLRSITRQREVRPRRVRAILDEDRAVRDGIPCTSVARTLLDLATTVNQRTLDRALRRAEEAGLFDRFALEAVLARSRPGTGTLRTAIAVVAGDEATRRRLKSELELRVIELLRRNGFVLPSTNVVVETPWEEHEVDTLWPEQRIVIELDGWWTHADRKSFNRDHRLATDVRAAGYDVSRLSWEQVVDLEPQTVDRLMRFLPRLVDAEGPPRP